MIARPIAASWRSTLSIKAVSSASSPAAGSSSARYGGTHGECARDLEEPLVDVRERARRRVESAAIADEGEEAFGDGGALLVVLRGKERSGP